ncbi:MAG: S8 family peptidase [Thermosynechococcaceae cyanobacterium]
MKKIVSLSLASAFLLGGLSIYLAKANPSYGAKSAKYVTTKEAVPGSYIVVLKDQGFASQGKARAPQKVRSFAQSLLASKVGNRQIKHVYSAALNGFSVKMSKADALKLSQDDRVEYISEDGIVKTVGDVSVTGTQTPATWGLDRIDQRALPLNNQYNFPNRAPSVHAYIIDTGILTTHPDFGGRATFGINTTGDGINDDCNGHGTHVAGTTGSTTYGVAKKVKLVSVKVLGCSGSGTWSGVIAGVDWVTANHISPAVANMSLGGGGNAPVDTAVQNSIASGVTYAVAAGNSNSDASFFSPARVPQAITVGATTITDQRSSFSNFGALLDIFAPGSSITSTWLGNSTNTISGTSMASPHVAGAAALYLQKNPTATPAAVATALINKSTKGVVIDPQGSPNRLLFR